MSERSGSILRALVGSELSTVVFVRDSLQLGFEEGQIGEPEPGVLRAPTAGTSGAFSAFTLPQLLMDGHHLRSGQPGYRDALVEQIGRRVTDADENDERLWFEFESGVVVTVSLAEEDLEGASVESAQLQLNDEMKSWMVWRPGDREG
jgi:hypothetical protein